MALDVLFVVALCGLARLLSGREGSRPRSEKGANANAANASDAEAGDLLSLAPGDMLSFERRQLVIRATLPLTSAGPWRVLYSFEKGDEAAESRLLCATDASEPMWLLIAAQKLALSSEAVPSVLEHDGHRYKLSGHFRTAAPPLRLLLYRGPANLRLLALAEGAAAHTQIYAGHALEPHALEIYARRRPV